MGRVDEYSAEMTASIAGLVPCGHPSGSEARKAWMEAVDAVLVQLDLRRLAAMHDATKIDRHMADLAVVMAYADSLAGVLDERELQAAKERAAPLLSAG